MVIKWLLIPSPSPLHCPTRSTAYACCTGGLDYGGDDAIDCSALRCNGRHAKSRLARYRAQNTIYCINPSIHVGYGAHFECKIKRNKIRNRKVNLILEPRKTAKFFHVWFEVLTAVAMKSSIVWYITPCSLLIVNRLILRPWRWRRHVTPKRLLTFNEWYVVISQKIVLFITTAVRTSNHTWGRHVTPKRRCISDYAAFDIRMIDELEKDVVVA
jgi:hypothetical protein